MNKEKKMKLERLKKIHFWLGLIFGQLTYHFVYFTDRSIGMALITTILFYIYWDMPSIWSGKGGKK